MARGSVDCLFRDGDYKQTRDCDVAGRADTLSLVATRPVAPARSGRARAILFKFRQLPVLGPFGNKSFMPAHWASHGRNLGRNDWSSRGEMSGFI